MAAMISGFCKDVFNELPDEFGAEVNQLMSLKLEGSVGQFIKLIAFNHVTGIVVVVDESKFVKLWKILQQLQVFTTYYENKFTSHSL